MKKLFFLALLISSQFGTAQVYINDVNLNDNAKSFELHMSKKPFTSKDCYYIDYGQKDFKEHFYDSKTQAVFDKDKVKFEKGEYMKLLNYLESQGWIKDSQRESSLGDVKISIVLFRKKV
jgi:hypothetical protein